MIVKDLGLSGVKLIEPKAFGDARGYFMETYQEKRYRDAGITERFVQDNVSLSRKGILRGLHFQNPTAQGKLVWVLKGEVFDVAVDIRKSSKTFGKWAGEHLSVDNKRQLYIPPGFAHGFVVTSDEALFCYKCTDYYDQPNEGVVLWSDPEIGIQWPKGLDIQVNARDGAAPRLRDIPPQKTFP